MSTPAADIGAQIEALRADRIAGKVSDHDFHERMQVLGPQWSPSAPAAPSTPTEAQQALADLQRRRTAGEVGDAEYRRQMDVLGPASTPEAELSAQAQADLDAAMTPPADPAGYQFLNFSGDTPTQEEQQLEYAIRTAFHDAQIPRLIAEPLYATSQRLMDQISQATDKEAAIEKHQGDVAQKMRTIWGSKFDARMKALDSWVNTIPGQVGEFLRTAPWALADVHTLISLDHLLRYQADKSKRKS